MVFGGGIALVTLLFAWLVLDIYLNRLEEFTIFNLQWMTLIVCPIALVCYAPIGKLYVNYQSKRKTLQQFVSKKSREVRKWYNKPLIATIYMPSVAITLLLYMHWTINRLDFNATLQTFRFRSLLAMPLALPIVYFVLRLTIRKASECLKKISDSN